MIAYLAVPIDAVEVEVAEMLSAKKREAYSDLIRHGFAVYDPKAPFGAPTQDAEAVVDINNYALDRSDVLLAVWPGTDIVSVGVPMEIYRAHQQGKIVAVVGRHGSLQLGGMGIPTFSSAHDACGWLVREYVEKLRVIEEADKVAERYTFTTVPHTGDGHKVKWTGDAENAPTQGYEGDAGFDLIVAKDVRIPAGGWVDVEHGIRCEFPPGTWAMIFGRSSAWRKRKVRVEPSIIDQGYRGPIFAAVQNIGDMPVELKRGDRIAQLIPFPLTAKGLLLERVAELAPSTRGTRAFGSTGH